MMTLGFTGRGRNPPAARPGGQFQGLCAALGASLLAHLLILGWSPSLASGSMHYKARASAPALRVSLTPVAGREEPEGGQRVPAPRAEAPPAPQAGSAGHDANRAEAATHGSVRLLGYFPVTELHRMPVAIGRFDIQPPAGGDADQAGRMTMRVWIGRDGTVERTQVLSSGLPEAYQSAAVAAFEKLRFSPGEINGAAVPSWADIVIEYADFRD